LHASRSGALFVQKRSALLSLFVTNSLQQQQVFVCKEKLQWTDEHNEYWKKNNFEFYKDDGGRETNYIDLKLSLVGVDGKIVADKEVPLSFSLIYDNDTLDEVDRLEDVMTSNLNLNEPPVIETSGYSTPDIRYLASERAVRTKTRIEATSFARSSLRSSSLAQRSVSLCS